MRYTLDARRASYLVEATLSFDVHHNGLPFNEPMLLENWETHETIITSSARGKQLIDDYYHNTYHTNINYIGN
jgi:hypothetical protein